MRAATPRRRIGWLTLYALAMGLLEAAVVVYQRELYYPEGFRFPVVIPDRISTVEPIREMTTLLMLLAVAALGGRGRTDRFFVFAFMFGVWDIVYYVGLWWFLGWPESLLTWDVLFLIPVAWLGPVLYPVTISVFLIAGFLVHDRLLERGRPLSLRAMEWTVAWLGALVVIVAFCWNWRAIPQETVPTNFPTTIFVAGVLLGMSPFLRATLRSIRGHSPFSPHMGQN